MNEIYVRMRQPDGTYEKLEVGMSQRAYPGVTRYYDCRKCGKRVAAGVHEDVRDGYCFQCIPRGMKLNGNNREERGFG